MWTYVFISLGNIPRSGFAGSDGNSICFQRRKVVIPREHQNMQPGDFFSGYVALVLETSLKKLWRTDPKVHYPNYSSYLSFLVLISLCNVLPLS